MADRLPTGRIGRLARVGYAAAGQAVRQAGTRTANVTRSEEEAAAALERRQIEAAEQIVTVLGGMKGAAEYEQLIAKRYPALAEFYGSTRTFTATKGMDAQTGIHLVIILFVLVGNVAFFLSRRPRGA